MRCHEGTTVTVLSTMGAAQWAFATFGDLPEAEFIDIFKVHRLAVRARGAKCADSMYVTTQELVAHAAEAQTPAHESRATVIAHTLGF